MTRIVKGYSFITQNKSNISINSPYKITIVAHDGGKNLYKTSTDWYNEKLATSYKN